MTFWGRGMELRPLSFMQKYDSSADGLLTGNVVQKV